MNMSKKIVFLCQFFYPEKVSSATLPFDTATALAEAGNDVYCLCGYPREYLVNNSEKVLDEEIVENVKIKRLRYKTLSRKSFLGRLLNYFSFTFKCLRNINFFKDKDYIIVYSNPPILPYVAYKANKKYGTKLIFVSYDVYPEIAINTNSIKHNGFIAKIMGWINKRLYPRLSKVVALSNDMKSFISSNRNIDEAKIEVIPNWFENVNFKPIFKDDVLTVTYLGNLGICQDIQTILDAANKLKESERINFIIGGHGSKLDYVKSYISNNLLTNVETSDFLVGNEYETIMNKSDVFVVSLEKNLFGLCYPSKYYSYLAYGRTIVAIMSQCELTNELVNNNIGYFFENGDSDGLSKWLSILSDNIGDVSIMSSNARELFEMKYTKEQSCKKYVSLFGENDS